MKDNPFIIRGYKSADLFCDREKETEKILNLIQNSVDITLISPRKFGKSGLIRHVFNQISQRNLDYKTIYVDIFSTLNLNEFIKSLSEAILEQFPEKTTIGKKFFRLLNSFRPLFSVDPLSGNLHLSFQFSSTSEQETSLKQILQFVNNQDSKVVLAIDEFQQIVYYPEKNVEALLREQVQNMHNTRFIFCGSKSSMMREIFADAKRPFFSSTRQIEIGKIGSDPYAKFILDKFTSAGRAIDEESVAFILMWTKRHTYYTQVLCNELFATGKKNISIKDVHKVCDEVLEENESTYMQYRALLTQQQWRFLIGLAKEDEVFQVYSSGFVSKYKIGNSTTSARAAESLVDKELVLKTIYKDKISYQVYDPFFSRWLAREY